MRRAALLAVPLLLLVGCDQEMNKQRKETTYAPSRASRSGSSARPLPEGVVARGDLERDRIAAAPPPVTQALLERGRERYAINCTPCHGAAGDGDGMIVRRGFPKPPSYHTQRLRAVEARYFYDVITDGYGVMYSYAARVQPADRWAIAAYIRALQLSRHATLAEAPDAAGRLP